MSENPSSIETVLAGVMRCHISVHVDPAARPYKTGCTCGEWCYDFEAHKARVLAAAVREHLLSDAVIERVASALNDREECAHEAALYRAHEVALTCSECAARAALTAATTERTDRD